MKHRENIRHHMVTTFCCLIFMLGLFSVTDSRATIARQAEAETVCRSWLTEHVSFSGNWAGSTNPGIAGVDSLCSGGITLAWCFNIHPRGYVVVPVLKELPPIKAFSTACEFDPSAAGFARFLKEILLTRLHTYASVCGDLAAEQPIGENAFSSPANALEWTRLLAGLRATTQDEINYRAGDRSWVGPLLTTSWHQGPPYNNFCPRGDGGRCIVGCVATAYAQILNYHNWPPAGSGHLSYEWIGDYSCGGSLPGMVLHAVFEDSYDWGNMPDDCTESDPIRDQNAVAELCYEIGVACRMNYGHCESSANYNYAPEFLPDNFGYLDIVESHSRSDHTADSWFELIQGEVNRDRPLYYDFRMEGGGGHAIVCDGWYDNGDINLIHVNFGWNDTHTAWYALDNIEYSYDPLQDFLLSHIVPDTTSLSHANHEFDYIEMQLDDACPNPCNPRTSIRFSIAEPTVVQFEIFDIRGRSVSILLAGKLPAGGHEVTWDGRDSSGNQSPTGIYFYRLLTPRGAAIRKLVLLK
jgi:Peptidase C10 family/FlgD Ig-like domain